MIDQERIAIGTTPVRLATRVAFGCLLALLASGAHNQPLDETAIADIDETLVVDCLLPGKIKRLGQKVKYVGARKPVKATALECGIRGGEFTEYDRSDYKTARKVWQKEAARGDAQAQNYLGEIYERGLGTQPDYRAAAKWYRKAADQQFVPALVNLAKLYEEGLGVAEDEAKALELYRRATGVPDLVIASELVPEVKELPAGAPRIELLDPLAHPTRGVVVVHTSSDVTDKMIRGRALAPAGLEALTVNGQATATTPGGVFEKLIAVRSGGTQVDIVAIDTLGQRAQRLVELRPDEPEFRREAFGEYHALVIGNNQHAYLTDLQTARADAQAVAEILASKYGFDVTTLLDASRYDILNALNTLRKTLTENDNLLIYYAGHGELDTVNARGYWLPVDAERESSANWISNVALTDILNIMSARHILVVADSCYSGALTRSVMTQLRPGASDRARVTYYKTALKLKSRLTLTSGALSPVLDAGSNGHSVFANAFLDIIRTNDGILEGQSLFLELVARVTEAAKAKGLKQVPQYAPIKLSGHEAGDFFLVPVT